MGPRPIEGTNISPELGNVSLPYTPQEAIDELAGLGYSGEGVFHHMLDNDLGNHHTRALMSIALGHETVDYIKRFQDLFSDDEHGPTRIENVIEDVNNPIE